MRRQVRFQPYQLTDREVWYRFDDPSTPGAEPYLSEFRVVRETPKGVVLDEYGYERFVLKEARKRFAYPTKQLALQSYLIRKDRQIGILAIRHDQAKLNQEMALEFAKEMGFKLQRERLVPISE